ncbi:MAG: CoB--CoM heterodisulfide reductase iron-sulfur subunit A family protein [Phycisphaerae bacterium]|nr:CoB--CoM heterodisulfide reductase iron-sulfur subunit A family protein [Phycisphaerae bacterium]
MTAAVEAAEVGYKVVLVEKEPFLGGRVVRMNQYFPKLCPPTCGMEINYRRIRQNPLISVYTLTEVRQVSGSPGDYTVTLQVNPRYVTGKVDLDESAAEALTSQRVDAFNAGMGKTKALYRPHPMAFPSKMVLDRKALSEDDKAKLAASVPDGAIDFDMQPQTVELKAAAIIVATGWAPYDAGKVENLGFGKCKNVITNIMMERLASEAGPTAGKIQRPGDGKEPANVAFVQCAGSRDENHLQYCSGVCCMASMKQARYVREKLPEAKVTIFYIDIRPTGRHEDFYYELLGDEKIRFVKGKVAKITEADGGALKLDVEDSVTGTKIGEAFDLVVLATGMVPSLATEKLPLDLPQDDYGFVVGGEDKGIFAAGVARHPIEVTRTVKEGTAAALKAIQYITQS